MQFLTDERQLLWLITDMSLERISFFSHKYQQNWFCIMLYYFYLGRELDILFIVAGLLIYHNRFCVWKIIIVILTNNHACFAQNRFSAIILCYKLKMYTKTLDYSNRLIKKIVFLQFFRFFGFAVFINETVVWNGSFFVLCLWNTKLPFWFIS